MNLENKLKKLKKLLGNHKSLGVAFSGGVDSSFLLAVAKEVFSDQVIAITAESIIHPAREIASAKRCAEKLGVPHILIDSKEMEIPEFRANGRMRCYHCKKSLFENMLSIVFDMKIEKLVHGANIDDTHDFRPGFQAAGELAVDAPMIDAGLTKSDIRRLSAKMGLDTWDRPSGACLASRIPYDTAITVKRLETIENAENILLDSGFSTCRVRFHHEIARIETDPTEFSRIMDEKIRSHIVRSLKKLGFKFVVMDLDGYVSGSLNRMLGK